MSGALRRCVSRRSFPPLSRLSCACFLAFALVFSAPSAARDEFKALRKQALKNSRTAEGKAYVRELYPAIGQDLANLLKKCTGEFPVAGVDSFEMVFRIDHFGEPKAILVRPLTDLSQCVARGFWYFRFQVPDKRFAKKGLALLLPISIT